MKHVLRPILIAFGLLVSVISWSQVSLPPSGNNQKSEVTQYLGLVKVTIVYNSPDVAGREIWGKLVPYGLTNLNTFRSTEQNPSPWRAGANENTTITFSHDADVEGKAVKAGTYGLHMIPGKDDWTIIFSSNSSAWGSFFYTPSEDVLRVSVKPVVSEFNEWLTYDFTDRLQNSATARLKWEKISIPFKISVSNGDELYVKKLRDEMTSPKGFAWQNVVAAANFCTNKKINLDEALAWIQTPLDRNIKYYPILQAKGNVLSAMTKKDDADAIMKEAINLPDATVAQITNYGRQLITEKRNADAMTVMQVALKRFPSTSVAMIGLARAYSVNGDNKKALKLAQDAVKASTTPQQKTAAEDVLKKLEKGEAIN